MRTVYLLSEGSYSAYHVICLFADRADAERFSERYTAMTKYADLSDIEEFPLYEAGEGPGSRTYHELTAIIDANGTVTSEGENEYVAWYIEAVADVPRDDHPHVHVTHRFDDSDHVKVVAWDREVAAKAFHDRVAKIRAEKMEL